MFLDNRFSILIFSSKATLKEVLMENIVKVFSLKISKVISECSVRKRELAEEKSVTKCVLMLL
jgi:hypothetical protein